MSTLLEVRDIRHRYRKTEGGRAWAPVLNGISFDLYAGECLGLIGESGSGKSTLGRILLGLEKPYRGTVTLDGRPLYARRRLWPRRDARQTGVSAVFQDYTASANPFMTVADIIAEPLIVSRGFPRREWRQRVAALLTQDGLEEEIAQRYPHQLSGGQMQRVCIARAIASRPKFIVLDEAVSALDMTVQVQILDLLLTLRRQLGLTYLFISHDVMAVTYLCQRVLFLQQGQIIERVDEMDKLGQVRHPHAQRLLQAVMTC